MNPTPKSAGKTSAPIAAPLYPLIVVSISLGNNFNPSAINLYNAPIPSPVKQALALSPPSSPARSTSAQAVPSG